MAVTPAWRSLSTSPRARASPAAESGGSSESSAFSPWRTMSTASWAKSGGGRSRTRARRSERIAPHASTSADLDLGVMLAAVVAQRDGAVGLLDAVADHPADRAARPGAPHLDVVDGLPVAVVDGEAGPVG